LKRKLMKVAEKEISVLMQKISPKRKGKKKRRKTNLKFEKNL
jgi:hypothetical protein